MKNILITGATGNVGIEVIRFLSSINTKNKIIAGVRNIEEAKKKLKTLRVDDYIIFDFEKPETFKDSLKEITTIFFLRPPQLADVHFYFFPLLQAAKQANVKEIVFLSVQGAEKSKIIPHNKIEKLIKEFNFNYVFLRPSYFMQNLTTTLFKDIKQKNRIFIPAGKALFNWVDVQNIGEVAAIVLDRFDQYKNTAMEITGNENLNFEEVTKTINIELNKNIRYQNPSLIRYYISELFSGEKSMYILVKIMLHYLPRFQNEPKFSTVYKEITGKKATTVKEFIIRERALFE